MATLLKQQRKLTPEEYLAIEEKAEYKSEYWDGVMVPLHGEPPELVGASENHNTITLNVGSNLRIKVSRDCRVFTSDMKVWVESRQKFYYPDVTVVCGKRQYYNNRRDVVENPVLIIEVLSDSTEAKDRGSKFSAYRTLESLREYVLIAQDKQVVEQYIRQDEGSWKLWATIGAESTITLFSLQIKLKLSEIYDLVDFENEEIQG